MAGCLVGIDGVAVIRQSTEEYWQCVLLMTSALGWRVKSCTVSHMTWCEKMKGFGGYGDSMISWQKDY